MADYERTVLDFYQLSSAYPTEWPADKDEAPSSDEDSENKTKKQQGQRRKSRFQALERVVSSRRSVVPGSEKSKHSGVANLVQTDEPDPLGTSDSVVKTLKSIGLPITDDIRLRNRFLLSSTTFQPVTFLSQVHAVADAKTLIYGLDVLSQSIDQKSASLKILVESNFERFVKAKETIDNVYREMKYRGAKPPSNRERTHSRHTSRNSFRSSSAGLGMTSPPTPTPGDVRKKNALVKESEYGVLGVKAPLLEASAKAEDVWGPALGRREKDEELKSFASQFDRFKNIVEVSSSISDSIRRRDYDSLVEEYTKARVFAQETKAMAQGLGKSKASDLQLYQIILAGRIWHDVEEQIQTFKRDTWRRLVALRHVNQSAFAPGQVQDEHMELIGLLLELGVEDNPIWVWLLSRYDLLKGKIQAASDRPKVEIEVLRRRLANKEKPVPFIIANHLQSLGRQSLETRKANMDAADVIELWEKTVSFLSNLLSPQGILGEVFGFWQTIQGFVDGRAQISLPVGFNGESRHHHRLSEKGITDLSKGTVELIDMIREHVYIFFAGPPPEDISLLFSPLPLTPTISGPSTPRDPRFNLDANNAPPSPKLGEPWEKFAFWPPWSNSISGAHYLSQALAVIGSAAAEIAMIEPVARGDGSLPDKLKALVGVARERCVTVLCTAWNRDAENIKFIEDWQRAPGLADVTRMPASFATFEGILLGGMQKILYISEAMSRPGAGDIVSPPPTKLLQMVRGQYVATLYKALSGMVENAERTVRKEDDVWTTEIDEPLVSVASTSLTKNTLDASDRNVRMLLTLSNLQGLRVSVVPSLNTQFENAFSVKLTDESKTIKDVLGQIDARLFQTYTRPYVSRLRAIVQAGITIPSWTPPPGTKPQEVKPYVYDALLCLVMVHSQVSTTAPALTLPVLSYLLEQLSRELQEAFRVHPRYPLEALMQATYDVEFITQTLSLYTSDRVSELRSQIYQDMDGRTDDDSRARLQTALPEMRDVLKTLRDASKTEFACFRKPKKSQSVQERTGSVTSIQS